MIDWDRHEIDTRMKLEHTILTFQLHGDLLGIPKDEQGEVIFYRPEDIKSMTADLYGIVLEEMKKHVDRNRKD